jgi:hypothetical protein
VLLDRLANHVAQHPGRQRIKLDAIPIEPVGVPIAFPLRRPRWQIELGNLLLGQRDTLNIRCRTVEPLA